MSLTEACSEMCAEFQEQPQNLYLCNVWTGHPSGHEAWVPKFLHGPHEVLCVTRQEQLAHHPVSAAIPWLAAGCLQVSQVYLLVPKLLAFFLCLPVFISLSVSLCVCLSILVFVSLSSSLSPSVFLTPFLAFLLSPPQFFPPSLALPPPTARCDAVPASVPIPFFHLFWVTVSPILFSPCSVQPSVPLSNATRFVPDFHASQSTNTVWLFLDR